MPPLRIFIVEDSSMIRDNLIDALRESVPVEIVGSAEDEATAIYWLQSEGEACDLAIIDIFLKNGSGLGVLKALAGQPHAPDRIILSNHATPEIRTKCQQLGAAKVFDKSNELEEMLAWLSRHARSDRAAAALRS